jgi:MGT family glycosyltransferase
MGTQQNKLWQVYEAIAMAAKGLDLQVVIALGNPDSSFPMSPQDNVIIVPFAPQLRLLDKAALAITHAGLNTALECLARGVPMVCMPVAHDQPGISTRIEWIGAGEVFPIARATAKRLQRVIMKVLKDSKYRNAAIRARRQLASIDGVCHAVDIIERTLAPDSARMPPDHAMRTTPESDRVGSR